MHHVIFYPYMQTLNIHTDGWGHWAYPFVKKHFLTDIFPHTEITNDTSKPADFIIRGHKARSTHYDVPYMTWSGEPYSCTKLKDQQPLFDLDTRKTNYSELVYLPHLVTEFSGTAIERPVPTPEKKWCMAYAASNNIRERNLLFSFMRHLEPTCYSFGRCCPTPDSPFVLPHSQRQDNYKLFHPFGLVVAMENSVHPGYLTEKIGHAFCAGAVPIYWGCRETAAEFFNPEAFIQVLDFPNIPKAAEYCVEVWRDKQKLQKYLDAPMRLNTLLDDYCSTEYRPWKKLVYERMREAFPDYS